MATPVDEKSHFHCTSHGLSRQFVGTVLKCKGDRGRPPGTSQFGAMNAVRVPWSHASFLVYLGGITILAAMLAFLSVESGENGAAGLVGWSALVLGVLATLAFLARRNCRFVTAGLYALSAV